MKKNLNIMGVALNAQGPVLLMDYIKSLLGKKGQILVATPNPEIILKAQADEALFNVLNKEIDLTLPDGFGLSCAALTQGKLLKRLPGADACVLLLTEAQGRGLKVSFLLWEKSLTSEEDLKNSIEEKYPHLCFQIKTISRNELMGTGLAADIIFISTGSPWQELQLRQLRESGVEFDIALAIGGALDFLSGKIKRAPAIFRSAGLEWLWRFCQEPRYRAKRIFDAVIVFPIRYINWYYIRPLFYRSSVVMMIYKIIDNEYYFLLVKRSDENNHWQLPQGGTDGQEIEKAARREIEEELNIKEISNIIIFNNIYKYLFSGNSHQFHGYKGQKQSLFIARFNDLENNIKLNNYDHSEYIWVKESEFIEKIYPSRKESAEIFLNKFQEIK